MDEKSGSVLPMTFSVADKEFDANFDQVCMNLDRMVWLTIGGGLLLLLSSFF
ncbi:TPA: hypothetical protein ACX6QF_000954 [Photobacterium damselae]|uniref:Uncharacterized protein n=2 Tax=Photobacterium damselae TaxID=38293 RepID=A0A2X1Y4H1_PHODM|nr:MULTISPECIES: hypothetical protein [Gammaproteobacteria]EHA1080846.1 hypothetical protein [Photobacterium damselae]EJN6958209.1 hypothetical protein [Photobacterium damselae]ELI6446742.1 hypothetical protein [Photobacterium damselae]MBA5682610.1 hypothetical protein [Photobacterium damselae subsp. damselae]MBF7099447.1 hypothetical protein [Photobacterium damselae]